jgi:hypothetical protein
MTGIQILKWIGIYKPEIVCEDSPFICVPKPKKAKKKKTKKPATAVYGGQTFVETNDGHMKAGLRDGYMYEKEVTYADELAIDEFNENRGKKAKMTVEKYTELKTWWAKGHSAASAAIELAKIKPRDGYGYGERTLDDYWTVYFKVHPYRKSHE